MAKQNSMCCHEGQTFEKSEAKASGSFLDFIRTRVIRAPCRVVYCSDYLVREGVAVVGAYRSRNLLRNVSKRKKSRIAPIIVCSDPMKLNQNMASSLLDPLGSVNSEM
jgi:hypothetical protein